MSSWPPHSHFAQAFPDTQCPSALHLQLRTFSFHPTLRSSFLFIFTYRICTLSAYAETMNTTTIRHPSKWLRALRTYSHQAWGTALYYDGAGFRKSLQYRVRFGTEQAGVRSNSTVLQRPCLPSTISTFCHRRSLVSNRRLQKDWVCAASTTLRCGIISRRCR
jgi:hypothetical protein